MGRPTAFMMRSGMVPLLTGHTHAGHVEATVHAFAARSCRAHLVALDRRVLRRLAVEAATRATVVAGDQSDAGLGRLVHHYLRAQHGGLNGFYQRVELGPRRAVEARVGIDHLLVLDLPLLALRR